MPRDVPVAVPRRRRPGAPTRAHALLQREARLREQLERVRGEIGAALRDERRARRLALAALEGPANTCQSEMSLVERYTETRKWRPEVAAKMAAALADLPAPPAEPPDAGDAPGAAA